MDTQVDVQTLFCEECGRSTLHEVYEDEESIGLAPWITHRVWWAECLEDGAEHGHVL